MLWQLTPSAHGCAGEEAAEQRNVSKSSTVKSDAQPTRASAFRRSYLISFVGVVPVLRYPRVPARSADSVSCAARQQPVRNQREPSPLADPRENRLRRIGRRAPRFVCINARLCLGLPSIGHGAIEVQGAALYQSDELERFKTIINLTEYAACEGYRIDRRESSRNAAVMRDAGGDKVVVVRGEDQYWVYFSIGNDSDNGSIIDFILNRRHCSLGTARCELRPWVGGSIARPKPGFFAPEVVAVSRDRAGVIRTLAGMRRLTRHRYLENERKIPRSLLDNPRFAGKIFVDARSNVIFPHADRDGPCG